MATSDFYAILGVSRTATQSEIKAAYRKKALELHPDKNPGASDLERERLTDEMSAVSQAYEVLSNEMLRRQYDRHAADGTTSTSQDQARSSPPRYRNPNLDECLLCGSAPVSSITIRKNVGTVFSRRRYEIHGSFCKFCGTSLTRQMINSTLMTGWWSLTSPFVNVAYILGDLFALISLGKMIDPVPPVEILNVPSPIPLHPGKPLLRRGGVWFAAILLAACIAFFALHTGGRGGGNSLPAGSSSQSDQLLKVGMCVTGHGNQVTGVTQCSNSHIAKIVGTGSAQSDCPSDADATITESISEPNPGTIICLDTKQ